MATLFNNVANTNTVNYVPVQATFDTSGNFLTFIGPGGVPFNTTSGGLTINTSTITGGTSGRVLYDNAGAVGELPTTGTGSVVLSNSPTLTGNVSANVNLRSDTLANLLPLAGGSSEVGYATDVNALVRFNGAAGQAQVLGAYGNGGTLNFTLNASNIADLTNPTSGVYIDCNNVSYLYVLIDPAIQGTSNQYSNLNIKLPNSSSIPSFKVFIQGYAGTSFWSLSSVTITLAYQTGDPASSVGYTPIAADLPTFPTLPSVDKPKFAFPNLNVVEINFVANIQGTSSIAYWTRQPLPGEGAYNFFNATQASIGTVITSSGGTVSLSSGVVANSSTMSLTPGMWLITGSVDFIVSSTLIATEIIAGINLSASTTTPSVSQTTSATRMTANLPTAGTFTMTLPPIVYTSASGTSSITRYGNARATFTAGTVSAKVYQRAIRIG
jgi:hypothetical protein